MLRHIHTRSQAPRTICVAHRHYEMLLNSAWAPGIIRIYQIRILRNNRFFFLKKICRWWCVWDFWGVKGGGKKEHFWILSYKKRSNVERGNCFSLHIWQYYIKRQTLMIPKQAEHIWLLNTVSCCFHHIIDYSNEEVCGKWVVEAWELSMVFA